MNKCEESLLCFHFPITCPASLFPSPTLSSEMWRISSLITLTFTLAISCLTMSNWPWFMNLTFQVPMQYGSLQHRTLLSAPDTSTTEHCFCFGPAASFFLELRQSRCHSKTSQPQPSSKTRSSMVCWILDYRKSFNHVQLFTTPWIIQSMEFCRPEYWSG